MGMAGKADGMVPVTAEGLAVWPLFLDDGSGCFRDGVAAGGAALAGEEFPRPFLSGGSERGGGALAAADGLAACGRR
jgi:hypothetical protein